MIPPGQSLIALDSAGLEIDHWLVMDFQLAFKNGLAEVLFQLVLLLRGVVQARFETLAGAASLALGRAESRSEDRRVGNEWFGPWRSRGSPSPSKKQRTQ